jgi:ribonuclease P protein component
MLAKKYRLNKTKDIEKVYKNGNSLIAKILGIKFMENGLDYSRFTFVVSTKIHKKSTKRNLAKRRMREAIRTNMSRIKPGVDVIFLARPGIIDAEYGEIKDNIFYVLKKAGLMTTTEVPK